MGIETSIEWCDHSWSPWRGCTKVSPGCANCYAERLSKRNPAVFGKWGKGKPRVLAKSWNNPVRWNRKIESKITAWDIMKETHGVSDELLIRDGFFKPRQKTVFPSLCDWLDDEVPIEWLARFLVLIHDTPNIDWLLLTKRPEMFGHRTARASSELLKAGCPRRAWLEDWLNDGKHPSNVWVGTSVEDQQRADDRIPALQSIPARLRFLSVEPLIWPVDIRYSAFNGVDSCAGMHGIHWVIVGGESGQKSRSCNVDWIRSIVRQCATAVVPCFVKQLGAHVVDERANSADFVPGKECWPEGAAVDGCRVILKHPKGGDMAEWPEDLRVRQFPEVKP